tara:strand:+ start:188 stop:481 length:294 start_codon:yes stop_codon:yes gene_type:complete
MIEPTEKQVKILESHINDGEFKCPSCEETWIAYPDIENCGEDTVQIFCEYGCGFIFIEEINTKEQKLREWDASYPDWWDVDADEEEREIERRNNNHD